jgi:hypothetical protein
MERRGLDSSVACNGHLVTSVDFRRLFVYGLGSLLFALGGCFAHEAYISVKPSSAITTELTDVEVKEATTITERTAAKFGMVPNPRLAKLQRNFRESKESPYLLITRYDAGPDAETRDRVLVFALVDKKTRRFIVLIENLDSMRATNFDVDLERAIAQSLKRRFPSRSVEVERKTVGPLIAP